MRKLATIALFCFTLSEQKKNHKKKVKKITEIQPEEFDGGLVLCVSDNL